MITQFKYEPFIRELKKPLANLIITHFQLCEKTKSDFADFVLVPVPLERKRMKWRGFNQSEEIAKELAGYLEIPLINDALFKIKETLAQINLTGEEREENIKGVFSVKNIAKIVRKRILLVDDVYTTGSTMNECARVLKDAGAKEIWGVAVARE
jgi:ComF family protein